MLRRAAIEAACGLRFPSARLFGAVPLPDPHNISSQLDDAVSDAIVARLESRGKDAVFRSLFGYFDSLCTSERVLELGCGTGVISRALVQHPGFSGTVTGVDQSERFVAAARELAAQDGCDTGRLRFHAGDAHDLGDNLGPGLNFDAVVMHTLLSHVTSPQAVLQSACRVLRPGGTLVVMDGDYHSLTYQCPDAALGRRMDAALAAATFAQPGVMRQLPGLLEEAGFELGGARAACVSEVGGAAQVSYWRSFAETYLPRVRAAGLVGEGEAQRWWAGQQRGIEDGTFFAHCVYYTMTAVKK